MEFAGVLRLIAHLMGAAVVGWFLFATYRWLRSRSKSVSVLFAAGFMGRAVVGLLLFWISYGELPIARSLQMGEGFWTLAPDAKSYYWFAASAVQTGIFRADYAAAWSPPFAIALTSWMAIVGPSPVAGLFLNLFLYAAFCRLLVWTYVPVNDARRDVPCLLAVAAYSFSPVLFIHATQPLKDDLFYLVVAILCLAMLPMLRWLVYRQWPRAGARSLAAALVAATSAMLAITEMRWYFSIIAWCALALVILTFTIWRRQGSLRFYVAASLSVLLVFGTAALWRSNLDLRRYFVGPNQPAIAMAVLSRLPTFFRAGFLRTGGNTNIVVLLDSDRQAASPPAPLSPSMSTTTAAPGTAAVKRYAVPVDEWLIPRIAIPRTPRDYIEVIALGWAVVFVPISLLKALSVVNFPGGGAMLAIADLDTVFQDLVIVGLLVLLWRRRHLIGERLPFVMYGMLVAAATATLLGFVVTNYGTLFRMRGMFLVPLIVLVVAVSERSRPDRARAQSPAASDV